MKLSRNNYETDADMVAGCLIGTRTAQEALYRKYKSVLFGICLRYTSDRDEAQDILQESFIKIFTRLHQFKNEGSLEGWLKRITVHTAIENYRKKQRHAITEELDESHYDDLPAQFSEYGDMEVLTEAIQKLPDGCRTVFNLFVVEGYSHKEIGQTLNISEGASRAQLAYARKKLMDFFLEFNRIPHVVS